MKIFDRVSPENLENRELHLSIFVSVTVTVLAVGTAVLMYPIVFSHQNPGDRTMRIAFFGYCALCVLLGLLSLGAPRHHPPPSPPDGRGSPPDRRDSPAGQRRIAEDHAQLQLIPGPLAHGVSPHGHHDPKAFHRGDHLSNFRPSIPVLRKPLRRSAMPPRSSLERCANRIPSTFWLRLVLARSCRVWTLSDGAARVQPPQ